MKTVTMRFTDDTEAELFFRALDRTDEDGGRWCVMYDPSTPPSSTYEDLYEGLRSVEQVSILDHS